MVNKQQTFHFINNERDALYSRKQDGYAAGVAARAVLPIGAAKYLQTG